MNKNVLKTYLINQNTLIRAKHEEIERVKTAVDEKDEETKKLQEEMADARRQLEVK